MKQLIAFLLPAILFVSCGSNKIPDDIIAKDRMEIILWQLMQSDEYVNTMIAKDSTKKSSTERMKIYQQVFDLNKTSMDQFKKSYRFYMEHPDITKVIFDSITVKAGRQRIELMRTNIDTLAQKADSIRRKRADSLATMRADSLHLRPVPGSPASRLNKTDSIKPRSIVPPKKRLKRLKKQQFLIHQ